jgi:hypothetical protein
MHLLGATAVDEQNSRTKADIIDMISVLLIVTSFQVIVSLENQ